MSRSRKKTPVCGNAGGSEKWDKRINNRMFRHREKICIASEQWDRLPINMNEVRSTWDMKKDGKGWFGWMKSGFCVMRHGRFYYCSDYQKLMRK